jgi:nicotinate (nicotinamide) nucleotide adenylyltransferase
MKNVLAFFGAFNPPTRAHVELADFAFRAAGREGVIFVPSRADYIRNDQGKDGVLSGETRLAMLEKLAETRPWMEVTDRELREPIQPRTYVTLCSLRKDGYTPSLLIGSDKLPELYTWKYMPDLIREFGIVCLARGGDDCRGIIDADPFLKDLRDHITLLETPDDWRDISSSKVREALREGRQEDLERMVPEEILHFVQDDTVRNTDIAVSN